MPTESKPARTVVQEAFEAMAERESKPADAGWRPISPNNAAYWRAQAEANAKDAARWRKLRSMVSGWRALGSGRPAAFKFPGAMELPPVTEDIMKGSVAQHLDAAIDAVMTAKDSHATD